MSGVRLKPPATQPNLLLRAAEANRYLAWRAMHFCPASLAEKADQAPPEALLQQAWLYQRVIQDRLQTADGRKVKVLHPGFWNHEPGPDFRKAVLQIGGDPPISGDVEIDLLPSGWQQHAHARNPAYQGVILHVTWEPESPRPEFPSLSLKHALDSTLPELSFWLGLHPRPAPEALPGECAGPLRNLPEAQVREILRQAAQARLLRKAEQMQARARQAGWEAALWENLFGALGFKRNVWPMRRMGELLPVLRADLEGGAADLMVLQARLFGVAGLLPSEQRHGSGEKYLRQLWDLWWREAESFREYRLPRSLWTLGGIRPANHPERRLALAAHWSSRARLGFEFQNWLERKIESPDLTASFNELLQAPHDAFWSYHWTLKSSLLARPQPLIGEQRLTDLAINVVLPWLYVRALAGRNQALAEAAERRYFLWPAGEDNAVLRLARQRLFGGAPARFLKSAAEQQGLLQISKDFCGYSNATCEDCHFPDLLRALVSLR